jgi:hypothetical protein
LAAIASKSERAIALAARDGWRSRAAPRKAVLVFRDGARRKASVARSPARRRRGIRRRQPLCNGRWAELINRRSSRWPAPYVGRDHGSQQDPTSVPSLGVLVAEIWCQLAGFTPGSICSSRKAMVTCLSLRSRELCSCDEEHALTRQAMTMATIGKIFTDTPFGCCSVVTQRQRVVASCRMRTHRCSYFG